MVKYNFIEIQKTTRLLLSMIWIQNLRKPGSKLVLIVSITFLGQVEKHNREIEEKSALVIQKHWRGYRGRKNFHQQMPSLTEYKAAVTLQRAVSLMGLVVCKLIGERAATIFFYRLFQRFWNFRLSNCFVISHSSTMV